MRLLKRGTVAMLAAVSVGVAVPAIAEAGDRYTAFDAYSKLGNDGQRISLFGTVGEPGLAVDISRSQTRSYESTYYATASGRARTTRRAMRGRLGGRGHAGMRFRQRGRRHEQRFGCVDVATTDGVFRGGFRFRSPGRKVDVHLKRMRARKTAVDFSRCTKKLHRAAARPTAKLTACGPGGLVWQASRDEGGAQMVVFGPDSRSPRRGLWTGSYAGRTIRPGAFAYAPDFSAASLGLPEPFRGAATYTAGELSGNLRWRTLTGERIDLMDVRRIDLAKNDRRSCASVITVGSSASDPAAAAARRITLGVLGPEAVLP